MKILEIANLVEGQIVSGQECVNQSIDCAFSSDLMSDVLTVTKNRMLLITGLVNIQSIRTAEMSDINCIVFARNKKVTLEMIRLATESQIVINQSPFSMFKASGLLFQAGIKPVF